MCLMLCFNNTCFDTIYESEVATFFLFRKVMHRSSSHSVLSAGAEFGRGPSQTHLVAYIPRGVVDDLIPQRNLEILGEHADQVGSVSQRR